MTEPARLPVDRVFSVEGFGTVVTGTLWRGAVRIGDTLALLPSGRETRVRRVQVHGATVDEARAGQRTAIAIHGVERDQVNRGDWLTTPGSMRASSILDVRFELLADVPRAWPSNQRVRFHLGASELIGRLVLLEGEEEPIERGGATRLIVRPGASALAQLRLERPAVAARGDRFVIRTYSPSRTIGGGGVIEPWATRRGRHAGGVEQLVVRESGSLAARVLERLEQESKPLATARVAQLLSEPESETASALDELAAAGDVCAPAAGRWLAMRLWQAARAAIDGEVQQFTSRNPARYGIAKGDLKSGLRASIDPGLFDLAFDALVQDGRLSLRAERVRPAASEWTPPAETLRALERVIAELEATGMSVPENPTWQAKLGAAAADVMALGVFVDRLVRVNQEFTYTATQLNSLRTKLVAHFEHATSLSVAAFKDLVAVSRKHAVPLLEHCDRVGWTVRVGDERKKGGRL